MDWDSAVPDKAYFDELFRVTKFQIIWGGNYFDLPPSKTFVIWDKGETMYNRVFAECEFAWVTPSVPAKIFKLSPVQADRIHPTQKPVKLYKYLLNEFAKPGFKILDTHYGSGSIGIACDDYGFDLVACEKSPVHYNDAMKRYAQYKAQTKLF